MPAVDEHGELDARRATVVEQCLDRRANRPTGVEHVVDEDARPPLEGEVELGATDERLRVERRLATPDEHVVAVERDVDGAEHRLDVASLGDERLEPACERNAARVDPDERELLEIAGALDHLVCETGERAPERFVVEDLARILPRGRVGRHVALAPSRPRWTGLKGLGRV